MQHAAPEQARIRIERWLRGRQEASQLAKAEVVVVSFAKSGRTWLRVMLSRFYQLAHAIPDHVLLNNSNYHRLDAHIPRMILTHDNHIEHYTRTFDSKAPFTRRRSCC